VSAEVRGPSFAVMLPTVWRWKAHLEGARQTFMNPSSPSGPRETNNGTIKLSMPDFCGTRADGSLDREVLQLLGRILKSKMGPAFALACGIHEYYGKGESRVLYCSATAPLTFDSLWDDVSRLAGKIAQHPAQPSDNASLHSQQQQQEVSAEATQESLMTIPMDVEQVREGHADHEERETMNLPYVPPSTQSGAHTVAEASSHVSPADVSQPVAPPHASLPVLQLVAHPHAQLAIAQPVAQPQVQHPSHHRRSRGQIAAGMWCPAGVARLLMLDYVQDD
jgi:hypothetical protein